ncbi:acyltransferase family protein [Mucilaginibacter sp. SP1R1]|uniref:acyltransferase family protein n=1 Tax=Mucilaginibacter sp. SP1R1 TaxID=2723091 RepID=UPI0016110829|nr:acyltransferase [Mucilaginibacter sp. SP1R1]
MNKNINELHREKTKKVYFPNLNGVRALAALMVVIAHIELHKTIFHIRRIPDINLLNLGKIGVTVFFSLSGFLITYLLLEEKRTFTHINFKGFYMRRLLRIWPLYFLVVLFGFLLYPVGSKNAIWLSVLFLPNLAFSLNLLPAIVDPIWSIGTEEQFYLFHPHFFRFKRTEHILYALLIFIIIIYTVEIGVGKLASANSIYLAFRNLMYYARFDNMMIGAIVAIIYNNTKYPQFKFRFQKLFDTIFKKWFQIVLIIAFIIYLLFYLSYNISHGDVLISVMASLLIVNLCETGTSIYSLQHKYLDYIGQISYGIYLLHKFCLFLVLYLVQKYLTPGNMIVENLIIYGATIIGVIGIASLSYYGYERPFLQIKKRFQKITQ